MTLTGVRGAFVFPVVMGALEKCPANGCRPERDRDLPLRARRRKRAESRFPNKASHPACRGVADARLAATYNQFLASDGKWMFMKPSIMKRMAESLQISLNYKAETELAHVLQTSGIGGPCVLGVTGPRTEAPFADRRAGFIWAAIAIEDETISMVNAVTRHSCSPALAASLSNLETAAPVTRRTQRQNHFCPIQSGTL